MKRDQDLEKLRVLAGKMGGRVLRAVCEDGSTAAAALLMESPVNREEIFLQHIYIHEKYRAKGTALEDRLLRYAQRHCVQRGANCFRVTCCGELQKMEGIYHYLTGRGFIPLVVQGRLMRYRLEEWLSSPFAQKIDLLEKHMESVREIRDWEDPQLQAFLATGAALTHECFDADLCRFYVVKGKIAAALCARRIGEKLLLFYNLCFLEGCPKQVAFVSMLASFIKAMRRRMPEDSVLLVQNNFSGVRNGLYEQFGVPDREYVVHEYYRPFSAGESDTDGDGEWGFEWLDPLPGETEPSFERALPLYSGLDAETIACLKDPVCMVPGTLSRERRNMREEGQIREWKKELNQWMEELGQEPYSEDKVLPFEAYLRREKAAGAAPAAGADLAEEVNELHYFVMPRRMEACAAMLPGYLRDRYLRGEVILIGGKTEAGVVAAYGAFSVQENPRETVLMHQIYVIPSLRRRGFGTKLLSYARTVLTEAGIRGIMAGRSGTREELAGIHLFLKQGGFQPIAVDTAVEVYYLQDLQDSAIMKLSAARLARLPGVETIPDRSDYRLRRFAHESAVRGMTFDRMTFDTDFCFFYCREDQICGAILMEHASDDLLLLQDVWFAEKCDSPYVRAALLSAVLKAANGRLRDDARLVMRFDRDWNLDAVRSLLGYGDQEWQLFEYVMPLVSGEDNDKQEG